MTYKWIGTPQIHDREGGLPNAAAILRELKWLSAGGYGYSKAPGGVCSVHGKSDDGAWIGGFIINSVWNYAYLPETTQVHRLSKEVRNSTRVLRLESLEMRYVLTMLV